MTETNALSLQKEEPPMNADTFVLPAKYPDGSIPCRCCGFPLGERTERRGICIDCERSPIFQYANPHDPAVCAQDREAVVDVATRMARDEEVPALVPLPSGRSLQTREPDAPAPEAE
jgi:hypothetical protein